MDEQAIKRNFYQLIEEYSIKVPIIQRDYAQGREIGKAVTVREHLIDALMEALKKDNKVLDLNFVYGTETCANNVKTFLPVDGQQRLTTLYLFYYYFFVVKGEAGIQDYKKCKSFSYTTRTSATDFFSWLGTVKEGNDRLCEAIRSKGSLKISIHNMPEYQAAWNNDPTVKSAIHMLDTIKRCVSKEFVDAYYSKLVGEACPIVFSVIIEQSVENANAETNADKTYIRMNARGKSLEDFENLRSMIDSLDEKVKSGEKKINIIDHYDQVYLDKLYDVCNSNILSLKKVTELINKKSYAAFKNIYNIAALCFDGLSYLEDEVSYKNQIHKYSKDEQVQNEVQKQSLAVYIEMLDTYFEYCNAFVGFDYNNCIFWEQGVKQNLYTQAYRDIIAEVIYCYYYKQKQKKLPTGQQVEDFKYVLKNLAMERWAGFWGNTGNLKRLCEAVSGEEDVFAYFNGLSVKMGEAEIGAVLQKDGAVNDLFVRFKEQIIKTKLIAVMKKRNTDISYRYFDTYERLYLERKLQFFLHAADCWLEPDDTKWNEDTFVELEGYLKKGQKWFNEDSTEHLEFLKRYAMMANLDDKKELKSEDDINRNCGELHIWKRGMCFWADADEYGHEGKDWKEVCALTKDTYCAEETVFNNAKAGLSEDAYRACWLRYAVQKSKKELLTRKLKNEEDEVFIETAYNCWRKYMLYVYKLDHSNLNWGEEEVRTHGFTWKEQLIVNSNTRRETIPLGKITLPLTKWQANVTATFNATLQWSISLLIENKSDCSEKDCLFGIEKKSGAGDNEYWYERVVYNKQSPYELIIEKYDISQDVDRILRMQKAEKEITDAFDISAFLELYEEARVYNTNRTNLGQTKDYIRVSPNSRTWEYLRKESSFAACQSRKFFL